MGRAIGRIILVPLGLLLGAVATVFILGTLGLEKVTQAMHRKDVDLATVQQIWSLLRDASGLAKASAIVPALLVIVVGEVARIRATTYYMVGGGAAVAALPLLARSGSLGTDLAQFGLVWQVFATAGFVGGFVYWLIAGRSA